MNKFDHVMVALAFGDYSEGIFCYAAALAQRLKARLSVVSIINSRDVAAVRTIAAMGYEVDGEHYIQGVRSERQKILQAIMSTSDFPAERVKVIFRVGQPIDELLRVVLEERADLIVMGIKGRTDLEHIFIGSVAEKMFRRSPVTVVSYRDETHAQRLKRHIHQP